MSAARTEGSHVVPSVRVVKLPKGGEGPNLGLLSHCVPVLTSLAGRKADDEEELDALGDVDGGLVLTVAVDEHVDPAAT